MVVLPCSNTGAFTSFVAQRLRSFPIPPPRRGMRLGEVEVHPVEGASLLAQYVAFATSVADRFLVPHSSARAIERIGGELGRATVTHPQIHTVAAPLLGAGAGRLDAGESVGRLTQGFLGSAATGALLRVHVPHRPTYERLLSRFALGEAAPAATRHDPLEAAHPLRVFISYAHTSAEHCDWVHRLYDALRRRGLNPRVDAESLRYGGDIPQWTANEIELADVVLMIFDDGYSARADHLHGGVGWEVMLIRGECYAAVSRGDEQAVAGKFVPVIRGRRDEIKVPMFLAGTLALAWPPEQDDEAVLAELLSRLARHPAAHGAAAG